jgi:hypothetical protein
MKKLALLLGLAVATSLLAAGPASAQQYGEIRMTLHTHSADDPDFPGLLFESDRLSWNIAQGEDFSYSSRTCVGNAPFNDLGLNFTPDYPGVDTDPDDTARVRHRVQGTVTAAAGDRGVIEGRITTVLCVRQGGVWTESNHVIVSRFWAQYTRISNNAVTIQGGFQILPNESTGTFRDMQGGGRFEGRFTCLGAQSNPSAPTCAQLGHFTDFVGHTGDPTLGPGLLQPGLVGTYYDPTVLPVTGALAT